RGETQSFHLQAKTLLVEAYAQAIFRFPAFTDSTKLNMGPEWFRASGAFSLKITTASLEMFTDGVLTVSPGGTKIFDIREQSVLIIKPTGFAGKYKLGAAITLPGVVLSGQLEAFINTFGTDQTFDVSPFLQDVVGVPSITIFGRAPPLNPAYDPTDATSNILGTPAAGPGAAYFTVAARADLQLFNTVTLSGGFRISIATDKVEVQAGLLANIKLNGTTLFSLQGSAAFAIDHDGFYGRAELNFTAASPKQLAVGFALDAQFILEFNTASISKDIQTF